MSFSKQQEPEYTLVAIILSTIFKVPGGAKETT
jgi:hypothetical protein